MSNTSVLSKIATAEKLEHKLRYAWEYCEETNARYTRNIEHRISWPESVAAMIHAHGCQGKRSQALKKIEAIHIVCMFLAYKAGEA